MTAQPTRARPRAFAWIATAALLPTLVLLAAAPVAAHDCSADESEPSDCYSQCTDGEDHHHFVDNDWPKENYECTSSAPAPGTYECNDGKDNDGDTLVDGADINCTSQTDNWEGLGGVTDIAGDVVARAGSVLDLVVHRLENSVLDTDDETFGSADAVCEYVQSLGCANNNDAAEGPAKALWALVQQAGPPPLPDGLHGPPAPPWLG